MGWNMPDYDGYLVFEDGELYLDGERIDGILTRSNVSQDVRYDEAEQDGLSGKVKTPMGWEDAVIRFDLDLTSDGSATCYDRLERINGIFRGADNGVNPKIYTVMNRHLRARGIDQVVFSSLSSDEDDKEDVIAVSLSFKEHRPAITAVEARVVATTNPTSLPMSPDKTLYKAVSNASGVATVQAQTASAAAMEKILVDVD